MIMGPGVRGKKATARGFLLSGGEGRDPWGTRKRKVSPGDNGDSIETNNGLAAIAGATNEGSKRCEVWSLRFRARCRSGRATGREAEERMAAVAALGERKRRGSGCSAAAAAAGAGGHSTVLEEGGREEGRRRGWKWRASRAARLVEEEGMETVQVFKACVCVSEEEEGRGDTQRKLHAPESRQTAARGLKGAGIGDARSAGSCSMGARRAA